MPHRPKRTHSRWLSRWLPILAAGGAALSCQELAVTAVDVVSVDVQPMSPTIPIGESMRLNARLIDGSGNELKGRSVTWASTNSSIAAVDATGLVAGVSLGNTTITASAEGRTGQATVTVTRQPVSAVEVLPPTVSAKLGDSIRLQAIVHTKDGVVTDRSVIWSSQTPAIASVDATGNVATLGAGTATIIATAEGVTGQSVITVAPVPVASVEIQPPTASLGVGDSIQLQAVLRAGDGAVLQNRVVTWTTTDPALVSVSATGKVRALGVGSATVTATSEGRTGQATISISPPGVAKVVVAPASATVTVGGSVQFAVTLTAADGSVLTGRPITWTSAPAGIATVDGNGNATGTAEGTATVTATAEGKTGAATIFVVQEPVTSVRITPSSPALFVGDSTVLQAVLTGLTGTVLSNRSVAWTTSDGAIARVTSNGPTAQSARLAGLANGTVTITATSEGHSAQVSATISLKAVATVTVTPSPVGVIVNGTAQLQAVLQAADGTVLTGRPIAWTSSDVNVATVSSTGLVTGKALGSAVVTATAEGRSGTATVNVSLQPVATVEVSPTTAGLFTGDTQQLTVVLKASDGTVLSGRVVTWTSSDPMIASVNISGLVTALLPGTATITATAEGKTGSSTITSTLKPVASVQVTPASPALFVGDTLRLRAVLRAADGTVLTGRPVAWTTNTGSVATVSATGLVSAVAPGSALITATAAGVSGQATVTVAPKPVASVTLTPSSVPAVLPGGMHTLHATTRAADGTILTDRPVAWTTSAATVATVTPSGGLNPDATVLAVAPGTAVITATAEGVSATISVDVLKPVASVTISPSSASVLEGSSTPLQATLKAADGTTLTGRPIAWTTSDATIATVNPNTGAFTSVTGVRAGNVTITATAEGVPGTASITVLVPVAKVTVTPSAATLLPGDTVRLQAVLQAADGSVITGRTVTWGSSGGGIASVNPSTGESTRVTAVGPGVATITASAEGKSDAATVTVLKPVAEVDVAPASASRLPGSTVQLTATLKASDGSTLTGRPISWNSSNPAVASITTGGSPNVVTVNFLTPGQATITATSEGVSGTSAITVLQPVASVSVTAPPALLPGAKHTMVAIPRAADGTALTGRVITWASADPAIATVDAATGVATAVAPGSVVITATSEGVAGTATLIVLQPVDTVVVDPAADLLPGDSQQMLVTLFASDATVLTGRVVTWTSSDPTNAPVSATGIVTVSPTATPGVQITITATAEGKSGSTAFRILFPVDTVIVTGPANVTAGSVVQYTATLQDANGTTVTGRAVVWTTSDPAVATVNANGLVTISNTALPQAKVTITATAENKSGSVTVTVN